MFERREDDIHVGFDELERFFSRMFGEFFGGRGHALLAPAEGALDRPERRELERRPFTDIQETEKEVIVTSELPGMEKDEIEIDVSEDGIEISAEKKYEGEKELEGDVHRERSYRRFKSAFSLPAAVDPKRARATYKNGVLEITLSKTEPGKKKKVKVE